MATSMYSRLLIALDLETDSIELIKRGRLLANRLKASMTLAHVIEFMPSEPSGEALVSPALNLAPELVETAKKRLDRISALTGVPDARIIIGIGHIPSELSRIAEEEAVDLIIAGAHKHHGLSLLAGHTERSLLRQVSCDLLVVRLPNTDST